VATIHIIQGSDKGRRFTLSETDETVLGRRDCDVELNDKTVSRHHFRLTMDDGAWLMEDLGAANGTFLNGQRVVRTSVVEPGDQIRCGRTLLVFAQGAEPAPPNGVDMDDEGRLVDAAIVATVPSNEDSVIIPTPEAGAEAIENLRILYDFIGDVSRIFDVNVLLRRTLDKVFGILKADRGFVLLIDNGVRDDDRPPTLAVKASKFADDSAEGQPPVSRTIINEVIRNEVGVLSSNAMSDKRFTAGKSVHAFSIRSAICVPIKGREGLLGVIHVDCSVAEHTYSTEQLRLLTAIGYQTGLAVENVRLYEATVQSERLSAVGETVAVLSHHIKNILQALQAGTDAVESALNAGDVDRARRSWPIVQRSLRRTNALIFNMLTFSKERQPQRDKLNVNSVIEECLELIGPHADEQRVAVVSDLDDLPPLAADAAGLQHALMNLLTNAMAAVEEEAGIITITSRYDAMNRAVVVSVIDNGSGIAEEDLDRIFTPFYSAKGQEGTGLGLAVTRKIIEEHGGSVDVNSTVGEGTTFALTLPTMPAGDSGETMIP